jgi:bifunctional aspartokinase / homoserine dehydrogenase 1
MRILKFGGTSVNSAEKIKNVIHIVKKCFEKSPHLAVIVSAFGGGTDELIHMAQQASLGNEEYLESLFQFKNRHFTIAEALIENESLLATLNIHLNKEFKELGNVLQGILLVKELSKRSLDLIMSFGERLSAYIISEAMKLSIPSALFLDAREMIKTDSSFGNARVNYDETYALIHQWFSSHTSLPVITGFIGSTDQNETVTLGRGGSDFTAAIFGAGLNAEDIEIWTDVDGVMTADPRKVQQAFPIPQMSYKEALEMSHFGAKVIHPPTILPALKKNIPIHIKNTFKPDFPGTLISHLPAKRSSLICGISSVDNIALLRLEGSGIVGVCGTAMRLFGSLAKKEINVILISQGSSEHTICFAISPQHADQAKHAIEEEFTLEMKAGLMDPVVVERSLSIIAIVGENMHKSTGVSGKLFGALGKNGINVVAIVQGSSEYNISVVIKRADEAKALNVIHEEFFLSPTTTLHVFLVGSGRIGSTLLAQMKKQIPILQKEQALNIKIVGLANSQKMCFSFQGIDLENWKELLHRSTEKMDVSAFVTHMKELNLSNSIFVDCTANERVTHAYQTILESNISIVTPNKKANSGSYAVYKTLKELSQHRGVQFLYETNVGAGLPIISTVINLLSSGDKIVKIEAILSGTLSYLFNTISENKSFTEALHEAQQKGYTEPDPREDLNGQDMIRKLLILVRESGHPLEMEDIHFEPLLPHELFQAHSVAEFYHKLEMYDEKFELRRSQAWQEGKVLRYIASFENGKAFISLQAVAAQHPFFYLEGSDNVIALTTERYNETPLVIKGAGAGAEVTAGEVFADIIRIGSS